MNESLIDQGVSLMLYGMGTVFIFLTILVFATGLMSKIVRHLSIIEEPSQGAPINATTATASTTQPSAQVLEAIKQAVAEHRAR